MKCTRCGAEIQPGNKFCPSCGAPTATRNAQQLQTPLSFQTPPAEHQTRVTQTYATPSQKKQTHRGRLAIILAAVVILLLGGTVGLACFDVIHIPFLSSFLVENGLKSPGNRAGENLEWVVNRSTLTISGSGKMWNWSSGNPAPWHDKVDSIRHIVLQKGVTSIGKSAFAGCRNISSVVFPNTVSRIEQDAFTDCPEPENVYYEGDEEQWNMIENNDSGLSPEIVPDWGTVVEQGEAYAAYLEAVQALHAPGSWTETMAMRAEITLPETDPPEQTEATMGYSLNIDEYREDDPLKTQISGTVSMAVDGENRVEYSISSPTEKGAAYEYVKPEGWTATVGLSSEYHFPENITEDAVSFSVQHENEIHMIAQVEPDAGNLWRYTTMYEKVGELEAVDMDVLATIDPETGKLAALFIQFSTPMEYEGQTVNVDYSMQYYFDERESEEDFFDQLIGKWEIDPEKTNSVNGESLMDLFGSSIRYGYTMTIGTDFAFSYSIAAGHGGEGTWEFDKNCAALCYEIETYETGERETGALSIEETNSELYLVMTAYDGSSKLYWKKTGERVPAEIPASPAGETGAVQIWENLISSGEYHQYIQALEETGWPTAMPISYKIFDLDGDGWEEILFDKQESENSYFFFYSLLTCDKETRKIETVFTEKSSELSRKLSKVTQYCKGIRYSPQYHALVYDSLNNGMMYHDFGYYCLKDGKLVCDFSVIYDAYDYENPSYSANDSPITEEEYQAYIDELQDIPAVKEGTLS